MKDKEKEKLDVKSLIALDEYLTILLEAYPQPVRAFELADKTDKSKAAVSKIRERLIAVCEANTLLLNKGFVLRSDTQSLKNLFLVFAATGRHRKFLSSKFVKGFISKKAIHPKICKAFPIYQKYFTGDDTEFIFTKLLEALSRIEPKDLQDLLQSYVVTNTSRIFNQNSVPNLEPVLHQIEFNFNKKDLEKALQIRDKLYLCIQDYLWTQIHKMEILNTLSTEEKAFYIKVYKNTTDFYLKKVFGALREPIIKQIKKLGLEPQSFPLEVGSTILERGN